MSAELLQVHLRRKSQVVGACPGAFQSGIGPNPDRIHRFLAVMQSDVVRWRGGKKEMRVETLGGPLRGDPVGKVNHRIRRQYQVLRREDGAESALAAGHGSAMRGLDL